MILTEKLRMTEFPYAMQLFLECCFWAVLLLATLTIAFSVLSSITRIYLNFIVPIALKYRLLKARIQSYFSNRKEIHYLPRTLSSTEILTPSDLFDTSDPVPPLSQRTSKSPQKKKSSKKPSTKKIGSRP
jgi:hypothetical protein